MIRRRLPKYVSEFADRHGKMRVRFRRKGYADYYFTAVPWSAEFMQEYQACLDGDAAPAIQPGINRTKPGTFNALIAAYYGSPEFKGLRPSSQTTYRGIIERFRQQHGDKRVALVERKHVKAIIGAMHETPAAANNLLDRLKALMTLAIDIGMRKDDPTLRMRGYASKGDGFHTWTEEEIAKFEARHDIGSKPRLALALMLYTGQRRSDAVTMGWQHVEGTKIKVRQQKTDARLSIPMHPTLRSVMAATPRENMTFLVTSFGKPFTPAGFGNWFRDRCNEAGLPHCSAHGLRKAAARRLAEAGCSNQQIKAITGHKTDKEVARYTAAADQVRLAEQAMVAAYGMDGEQKMSNRDERLDNPARKSLKRKDA
jgi:integrase